MIKLAKDKWAKKTQRSLNNIWQEADSCAAIDGAGMTPADRKKLKELTEAAMQLLSKY